MPVQLQRRIGISLKGRVLTLEMRFPDAYSAAVYHDDIVERLSSGDGCSIVINAPKREPVTERGKA